MKNNVEKIRGEFGETAVCDFLAGKGYEIVARNYRIRRGEIDIITVKNFGELPRIIFTEVKTRKFGSISDGIDSITREKRRRIVRTARHFLSVNPQFADMNAQFDAARVVVTTDEFPRLIEIDYYEDAFDPMYL
jgi:putative endonuclease